MSFKIEMSKRDLGALYSGYLDLEEHCEEMLQARRRGPGRSSQEYREARDELADVRRRLAEVEDLCAAAKAKHDREQLADRLAEDYAQAQADAEAEVATWV
jgi:hypothetical protein